jgi:hypothetical protein
MPPLKMGSTLGSTFIEDILGIPGLPVLSMLHDKCLMSMMKSSNNGGYWEG